MRRFIIPVAVALIGLLSTVTPASAQKGKLLPGKGLGPKMRISGISQKNGIARIVVRNDGNFGSPRRLMKMQIFRGGRRIGSLQAFVGAIPARGSRVVLMRTGLRLSQPGTVLAFGGNGFNSVIQRGANNRFLLSKRPLSAVLASSKGLIGRPGKGLKKGVGGGADAAAAKAEAAAQKAEAARQGAEEAKEEAEAVVEEGAGEGEGEVEGEVEGEGN
jgi:hypothetical protein